MIETIDLWALVGKPRPPVNTTNAMDQTLLHIESKLNEIVRELNKGK